jgi:hypothetical protein
VAVSEDGKLALVDGWIPIRDALKYLDGNNKS